MFRADVDDLLQALGAFRLLKVEKENIGGWCRVEAHVEVMTFNEGGAIALRLAQAQTRRTPRAATRAAPTKHQHDIVWLLLYTFDPGWVGGRWRPLHI
jgi:hypothetical protein